MSSRIQDATATRFGARRRVRPPQRAYGDAGLQRERLAARASRLHSVRALPARRSGARGRDHRARAARRARRPLRAGARDAADAPPVRRRSRYRARQTRAARALGRDRRRRLRRALPFQRAPHRPRPCPHRAGAALVCGRLRAGRGAADRRPGRGALAESGLHALVRGRSQGALGRARRARQGDLPRHGAVDLDLCRGGGGGAPARTRGGAGEGARADGRQRAGPRPRRGRRARRRTRRGRPLHRRGAGAARGKRSDDASRRRSARRLPHAPARFQRSRRAARIGLRRRQRLHRRGQFGRPGDRHRLQRPLAPHRAAGERAGGDGGGAEPDHHDRQQDRRRRQDGPRRRRRRARRRPARRRDRAPRCRGHVEDRGLLAADRPHHRRHQRNRLPDQSSGAQRRRRGGAGGRGGGRPSRSWPPRCARWPNAPRTRPRRSRA